MVKSRVFEHVFTLFWCMLLAWPLVFVNVTVVGLFAFRRICCPQLFPYHLSDVLIRKMRYTPFTYYLLIMQDTMLAEKSYDSLPNFTAADGESLQISVCTFQLC